MKTRLIILGFFLFAPGCTNSYKSAESAVQKPNELKRIFSLMNDDLVIKTFDLYAQDRTDLNCRLIIDSYYESRRSNQLSSIDNFKNQNLVLSKLSTFVSKDSYKSERDLDDIKRILEFKTDENNEAQKVKNEIFYNAVFTYLISARTDELTRIQLLSPLVHRDKILEDGKREIIVYATSPLTSEFGEIEVKIQDSIFVEKDLITDSLFYGGIRYIIDKHEDIDTLLIQVGTFNRLTGESALTTKKYPLN